MQQNAGNLTALGDSKRFGVESSHRVDRAQTMAATQHFAGFAFDQLYRFGLAGTGIATPIIVTLASALLAYALRTTFLVRFL